MRSTFLTLLALSVAAYAAAQVATSPQEDPAQPPPPTLADIGMLIYPASGQSPEQQKADELL